MMRRSRNRTRRTGNLAASLIVVCAVVVAGWIARPRPSWEPPVIPTKAPTVESAVNEVLTVDPVVLAAVARRDWQRPLHDPPVAQQPPPPPKQRPQLELVGTAVENDRAYAMIRVAGAATKVFVVGDELAGFEITAITRGSVQLQAGEDRWQIQVPWYDQIAGATP